MKHWTDDQLREEIAACRAEIEKLDSIVSSFEDARDDARIALSEQLAEAMRRGLGGDT